MENTHDKIKFLLGFLVFCIPGRWWNSAWINRQIWIVDSNHIHACECVQCVVADLKSACLDLSPVKVLVIV